MKLLYICTYQFFEKEGIVYTVPAYGNVFWDQFTDVFDEIDVLGEPFRDENGPSVAVPITREDVKVRIIPANTRPNELRNDFRVKQELKSAISNADAILIKIASRKAIMAINYAKKYNKPYMIGVTGDLYRDLCTSENVFRRMYAPLIYRKTLKAIKDCKYGTYVTLEYLQRMYPIEGKMCGFTDTVLPYVDDVVLNQRLKKIREKDDQDPIIIGLIGTYHDNRKGIDTIIESLERINNPILHLHILGVGDREDRDKWIEYGKNHNVKNVFFDEPVSGVDKVFKWIDDIDICVLPSRSEGLPRCIVEALSRGCPCIISNVCGMPELVNKKWLHDPEDVDTLTKLLINMIQSRELMIEAAKENHARSKEYCLEYITKKRNTFFGEFKEYSMKMLGR